MYFWTSKKITCDKTHTAKNISGCACNLGVLICEPDDQCFYKIWQMNNATFYQPLATSTSLSDKNKIQTLRMSSI